MASITVRSLPDEVHRALKLRAAGNARSTEAEVRAILEEAVRPKEQMKMGTALRELGRRLGGLDLHIERDKAPAEGVSFE